MQPRLLVTISHRSKGRKPANPSLLAASPGGAISPAQHATYDVRHVGRQLAVEAFHPKTSYEIPWA
jgi:hypothetical protein